MDISKPSRRRFGRSACFLTVVCFFAAPGIASAAAINYLYDGRGRVIQAAYPNGVVVFYAYDAAGNRTQITQTTPGATPAVIQVTAAGVNLRTLANNAGYAGATNANYQFVVPSGVTLTGSSGGGSAISTGVWPLGVTLSLVINGTIYGGGGNGGSGGSGSGPGTGGGAGGDAITVQAPIAVTINSGAVVMAGGGGGGGSYTFYTGSGFRGGNGGGGGFPDGVGGPPGSGAKGAGVAGGAGTTSGGGYGGTYPSTYTGGAGGGAAQAGMASSGPSAGAGGAAGLAVRENGYAVTVTTAGTVTGGIQ